MTTNELTSIPDFFSFCPLQDEFNPGLLYGFNANTMENIIRKSFMIAIIEKQFISLNI